jgi:hypothetical protein
VGDETVLLLGVGAPLRVAAALLDAPQLSITQRNRTEPNAA